MGFLVGEISAGLSSLKAATDIVQSLGAVKTEAAINGVKIDLQSLILDAQQGLFAAQEAQSANARRIAQLEQEIVRMKNWEREKQRYELKRFFPGAVAYCLKPSMADGEPPHRICPECYQHGKKGHLQVTGELRMRYSVHHCASCKNEAVIGQEMPPPEPPVESATVSLD